MMIGFLRALETEASNLEDQKRELENFGVTKFFSAIGDVPSAAETLTTMLKFAREEDVVVVTSLDRIASTVRQLCDIQAILERKKIDFVALDLNLDTRTSEGAAMMGFLPKLREMRRRGTQEVQRKGIAIAKAAGRYKGRKPTARAKTPEVLNAYRLGRTVAQIVRDTGIGRASVYRILEANGLWAPHR